jgi:hypothetical protein
MFANGAKRINKGKINQSHNLKDTCWAVPVNGILKKQISVFFFVYSTVDISNIN